MNKYMQMAIEQAKLSQGDIPVGAVVVKDDKIIAKACNTREKDNDITSHAEILALREASKLLNNWRLDDCDMYVTLEPCPMCGWAILQSRLKNLYFGSFDMDYGAFSSADLLRISKFKTNVLGGIEEDECTKLLKKFFMDLRKKEG